MTSGEMSSTAPVTMALESESRWITEAAVSIGRRMRPASEPASASSSQQSPFTASCPAFSASVRHQPMLIWLTRMRDRRSSAALFLVIINGAPPCAQLDPILTIEPPRPAVFIAAAACLVSRKGPVRLIRIMFSQLSSVVVSRLPRGKQMAAEFTRPSSWPNRRTAASTVASQSSALDISAATASPRSAFRPQISTPHALATTAHRATSFPRPPVEPVTMIALPVRSDSSFVSGAGSRVGAASSGAASEPAMMLRTQTKIWPASGIDG
eukprot:scaffold4920_cov129-Isochrysis_galbana.AAC.3